MTHSHHHIVAVPVPLRRDHNTSEKQPNIGDPSMYSQHVPVYTQTGVQYRVPVVREPRSLTAGKILPPRVCTYLDLAHSLYGQRYFSCSSGTPFLLRSKAGGIVKGKQSVACVWFCVPFVVLRLDNNLCVSSVSTHTMLGMLLLPLLCKYT